METTPLRIYLHDIEGMIGAGQTDEAIAHCRHILQTFPKSIAVYRLLGKAYLENQRYSDAADLFQRVLSAVPDDFVSHVGMSIIREDEGNQDASIWHMERAFETQPYNSAIQDELRRLYGRRDGMEPPKIRLTRGALARLYVKGDLYQQAIGELRAALAEDPQRPDLQALLARVYYMAGQRVEAVETCSTLLKKLPYCLDANILLGAILPDTERAQDAQNYRQRAMTLEPYFAQAPSNAQTADNIPASAISVEKLIYSPSKAAAEEGQPAWATSLGVAFQEQKEVETLPEWLSTSVDTSLTPEGEPTPASVSPFSQAETPSAFPWEASSEEAAPAEAVPDWMKEAGWTPATGEAKEGPISFGLEEEAAAPIEGALAPADIPDWLREAAPPGVLDQSPAPAQEKPAEEELPWLQETPPGPSDTIVTWLNATKAEIPSPTEEIPPATPAEFFQQPETEGTGLANLGALAETADEEIPDWLKESAPTAKTEAAAETTQPAEIPDWLQPAGPTAQAASEEELPDWLKSPEAETPGLSAELPDWLKTETPAVETPAAETEQPGASMDEIPDWLKIEPTSPEPPAQPAAPAETIAIDIVTAEVPPVESAPVEAAPAETAPVETAAPAEEFPAWLKEVEAEIPEEAVETPQLKGVTEWLDTVNTGDLATGSIGITDWLSKIGTGQETPPAEPGPAAVDIFPWLRENAAGEQEAAEATPTASAEEIPDWMREIGAGKPEAAAAEVHETAEAEMPGLIPPAAEAVQAEITPAFEGELPAGLDLTDQDAALAWLEGLAARQGVPEEELFTKPEERAEVPSAWVLEVAAGVQEAAGAEVQEAAVVPSEEIPEWMREVVVPEGAAPAVEAAVAVPAEEVPDWLKEAAAEVQEAAGAEVQEPAVAEIPEAIAPTAEVTPTEAVPVVEGGLPAGLDLTDQDAALAWLEGLAARQGVPEEELITKPEERAEVPPTWVPEVAAGVPEAAGTEVQEAAGAGAQEAAGAGAQEAAGAEPPAVPAEEIPEWMREVELPEVTTPSAEVAEGLPVEEIPDWLKAVEVEIPEEVAPTVEVAPAAPAEELPDWLKEAAAEVQEAAGAEVQETAAAEIPEAIAPTAEVTPTEAAPLVEGGLPAGLDLTDQDAALAWLEGLAARQGVPEEELITKPEERAEVPPAWVPEVAAGAQEAAGAEAAVVPAEEIPEWMREVVVPEGAAPTVEAAVAAPAEEIPEWMREIEETAPSAVEAEPVQIPSQPTEWVKETELSQWLEKTELVKPEEKTEPEAELPGWMAEMATQDTDDGWKPPQTPEVEAEEKDSTRALTNLNSAAIGELERLPGIGFVLAQSIINHRESQGPFTRVEDLLDVPGIGPGILEFLQDWITIEPLAVDVTRGEVTSLLDPDHIILRQAHKSLQQGDIPAAIKQYELLLNTLVLLNEIILDLQDALYRYPVDITIWQALGDAYMRNNQLQDALDAYTKAEELLR